MPLGSALIFLMAGPATNAATIGTINRTFGLKRTIIYLITIIVGSVGGAFLFEMIWGETAAVQMSNMHEHGFSMVEYAYVLSGYWLFRILYHPRRSLGHRLEIETECIRHRRDANRCTPSSRNDLSGLC